jgi:4-hydroxybenzoate polyprenyltransferase
VKRLSILLRLLRVNQWTKNGVVFAAFFFALGDLNQDLSLGLLWKVALAALAFALVSSAVYILNDLRDAPKDRLHPVKRRRPIASGEVPVPAALAVSAAVLAAGLWGAWWIAPRLFGVVAAYFAMQLAYTFGLKAVSLVDVMIIAAGFVLRAIAGAEAIAVPISPWLLVCTFFLALFLALCKRRHEKLALDGQGTRAALEGYDAKLLDLLVAVSAGATIVVYSIYTLWPDTVAKFGTNRLAATIPFVVFGVFRYLDLAYRREQGERPERVLLTDLPLLADIALFGATVLAALFLFRG